MIRCAQHYQLMCCNRLKSIVDLYRPFARLNYRVDEVMHFPRLDLRNAEVF